MDLGSELGRNEDVKALLIKHRYNIQPTAPDASYQNSSAEQPHETIGNAIRVYVRPPGKRSHKLSNHINKGIFLGYTTTMSNMMYYNNRIHCVKTATHAHFDEGMNGMDNPPPN
eukprot:9241990-Ditylum_brightwellii.AAC.1